MKKTSLYIFSLIMLISACEKDDFCLQNPVTQNLTIEFYNNSSRETLKDVTTLYLYTNTNDTLYDGSRENSITVPLDSQNIETVYNFSDGTNVDQFTITYETKEEYVSRSCGFKIVFSELTFISNTNNWILDYTPGTLTELENTDTPHVQIFH